jgi:hypothetical protein
VKQPVGFNDAGSSVHPKSFFDKPRRLVVGRDLAITGGNDMGRPSTVETADGGVTAVGVARLATAMLMAAAAERTALVTVKTTGKKSITRATAATDVTVLSGAWLCSIVLVE